MGEDICYLPLKPRDFGSTSSQQKTSEQIACHDGPGSARCRHQGIRQRDTFPPQIRRKSRSHLDERHREGEIGLALLS